MESGQSLNPYSYTDARTAVADDPERGPAKDPPGVIVLAILFLMMGGFGLLGSLGGAVALVFHAVGAGSSFVPSGPGMELQRDFQSQMDGVNARLLPFTATTVAGNFLLSIPLVVAAVAMFSRKEWARVLALRTIVACAVFTVLEIALGVVAMYLQQSIIAGFFEAAAAGTPMGSLAGMFIYVMTGLSAVMLVVMYGIEYGIYAFGYRYLRKPEVKASFA